MKPPEREPDVGGNAGPAPRVMTFTSSSFVPQDALEAARDYVAPTADTRRPYSRFGFGAFMRPEDSDPDRLRKAVAVGVQIVGIAFTAQWFILFHTLGLVAAARVNLIYNALCVLNIALFVFTKRLFLNVNIAFALVTIYVVVVQLLLGGMQSAGFVIVWAILAPLLSSVLFGRRASLVWWGVFVCAMALSAVLEQTLALPRPELPAGFGLVNSVLNVGAFSAMVVATNYVLTTRLDQARARADALLRNILPGPIADRLKAGQKTVAEYHQEVTILFADIVGFTTMASRAEPVALVALLNAMFSKFDRLSDELGLEKIKTIGDAYMVAGGLPHARLDHAEAVARMALGMIDAVANQLDCHGDPVQIRVGIHTGSVVAGVIGRRKFSYDLWGDVVNVASRMESSGEPGRIHVSAETHERLTGLFQFESRPPIEVKGRGKLQTYFLVSQSTGPGCAGKGNP